MKSVNELVSPFIASQFPSFYKEGGYNLIAFVEAYYQWLERNYQRLELVSVTDFEEGDTITQGTTTGQIVTVDGNYILVKLNGFDQFRCNVQCNDYTPVTSSSGGNTYIRTQSKLNPLYNARKLPRIRDVDTTLDSFLTHFKEKYLKNIEFDTASNKRLLVKNALDLYRAKGTDRAVDLFFRLIYGVSSSVEYPGERVFQLSNGEWYKPRYLEITYSPRTVDLVGKQITGVTSGATAFVEKYIKRKVGNTFVYVLYLSNIRGEFLTDELIKNKQVFSNLPKIKGSLSAATVTDGSSLFSVGDIVYLQSSGGEGGLARVSSISEQTGTVSYEILDGGFGYTVNSTSGLTAEQLAQRTQSITSESVLQLSNVVSTDSKYFSLFESITQPRAEITYDTAANNQQFAVGSAVYVANTTQNTALGIILSNTPDSNTTTDGVLVIGISDNGTVTAGDDIKLSSNALATANIGAVNTAVSATANVMGIPTKATLHLTTLVGGSTLTNDHVVYQVDGATEVASGRIASFSVAGITGAVYLEDITGVFTTTLPIAVRGHPAISADVAGVSLSVGVYNTTNTFSSDYKLPVFTGSVTANLASVSQGTDAEYKVGLLENSESVYLNTDLLADINSSNIEFMTVDLDSTAFGFAKDPTANISSTIFSALTFEQFTIGTIATLAGINPGANYNADPYTLNYQPLIANLNKRDYIIEYNNATAAFVSGERINQESIDITSFIVEIANTADLSVGEKVYQDTGSANGFVYSVNSSAVIITSALGTFTDTGNLYSYSNLTFEEPIDTVTQSDRAVIATGIVKDSNTTHLYIKRLQFENYFESGLAITGVSSGATADIVSVVEDQSSLPIGLNANVEALVATSNGIIDALEVTDSGYGFKPGSTITFTSEDGTRTGSAVANVAGIGTASGYYRNSGSLLDDEYKIHDGDYYQEYSYEIFSRIPLDKYADMFRKVLHTSGTKFFGSVLLEEVKSAPITYANSSLTIS